MNVKKASPKNRRLSEQYRSRHNLGRRSAVEKVASYHESDVNVAYPAGFWDTVKVEPHESSDSDSTGSESSLSDPEPAGPMVSDDPDSSDISDEVTFKQPIASKDSSNDKVGTQRLPRVARPPDMLSNCNNKSTAVNGDAPESSKESSLYEFKGTSSSSEGDDDHDSDSSMADIRMMIGESDEEASDESDEDFKCNVKATKKTRTNIRSRANSQEEETNINKNKEKSTKDKPTSSKPQKKVLKKRKELNAKKANSAKAQNSNDSLVRAPRLRRTACLNANAINHLLYEADEPDSKRKKQKAKETSSSESSSAVDEEQCVLDSSDDEISFPKVASPKKDKVDNKRRNGSDAGGAGKAKRGRPRKRVTNKASSDDSRSSSTSSTDEGDCKNGGAPVVWAPPRRMASLNAQAFISFCKDTRSERVPRASPDVSRKRQSNSSPSKEKRTTSPEKPKEKSSPKSNSKSASDKAAKENEQSPKGKGCEKLSVTSPSTVVDKKLSPDHKKAGKDMATKCKSTSETQKEMDKATGNEKKPSPKKQSADTVPSTYVIGEGSNRAKAKDTNQQSGKMSKPQHTAAEKLKNRNSRLSMSPSKRDRAMKVEQDPESVYVNVDGSDAESDSSRVLSIKGSPPNPKQVSPRRAAANSSGSTGTSVSPGSSKAKVGAASKVIKNELKKSPLPTPTPSPDVQIIDHTVPPGSSYSTHQQQPQRRLSSPSASPYPRPTQYTAPADQQQQQQSRYNQSAYPSSSSTTQSSMSSPPPPLNSVNSYQTYSGAANPNAMPRSGDGRANPAVAVNMPQSQAVGRGTSSSVAPAGSGNSSGKPERKSTRGYSRPQPSASAGVVMPPSGGNMYNYDPTTCYQPFPLGDSAQRPPPMGMSPDQCYTPDPTADPNATGMLHKGGVPTYGGVSYSPPVSGLGPASMGPAGHSPDMPYTHHPYGAAYMYPHNAYDYYQQAAGGPVGGGAGTAGSGTPSGSSTPGGYQGGMSSHISRPAQMSLALHQPQVKVLVHNHSHPPPLAYATPPQQQQAPPPQPPPLTGPGVTGVPPGAGAGGVYPTPSVSSCSSSSTMTRGVTKQQRNAAASTQQQPVAPTAATQSVVVEKGGEVKQYINLDAQPKPMATAAHLQQQSNKMFIHSSGVITVNASSSVSQPTGVGGGGGCGGLRPILPKPTSVHLSQAVTVTPTTVVTASPVKTPTKSTHNTACITTPTNRTPVTATGRAAPTLQIPGDSVKADDQGSTECISISSSPSTSSDGQQTPGKHSTLTSPAVSPKALMPTMANKATGKGLVILEVDSGESKNAKSPRSTSSASAKNCRRSTTALTPSPSKSAGAAVAARAASASSPRADRQRKDGNSVNASGTGKSLKDLVSIDKDGKESSEDKGSGVAEKLKKEKKKLKKLKVLKKDAKKLKLKKKKKKLLLAASGSGSEVVNGEVAGESGAKVKKKKKKKNKLKDKADGDGEGKLGKKQKKKEKKLLLAAGSKRAKDGKKHKKDDKGKKMKLDETTAKRDEQQKSESNVAATKDDADRGGKEKKIADKAAKEQKILKGDSSSAPVKKTGDKKKDKVASEVVEVLKVIEQPALKAAVKKKPEKGEQAKGGDKSTAKENAGVLVERKKETGSAKIDKKKGGEEKSEARSGNVKNTESVNLQSKAADSKKKQGKPAKAEKGKEQSENKTAESSKHKVTKNAKSATKLDSKPNSMTSEVPKDNSASVADGKVAANSKVAKKCTAAASGTPTVIAQGSRTVKAQVTPKAHKTATAATAASKDKNAVAADNKACKAQPVSMTANGNSNAEAHTGKMALDKQTPTLATNAKGKAGKAAVASAASKSKGKNAQPETAQTPTTGKGKSVKQDTVSAPADGSVRGHAVKVQQVVHTAAAKTKGAMLEKVVQAARGKKAKLQPEVAVAIAVVKGKVPKGTLDTPVLTGAAKRKRSMSPRKARSLSPERKVAMSSASTKQGNDCLDLSSAATKKRKLSPVKIQPPEQTFSASVNNFKPPVTVTSPVAGNVQKQQPLAGLAKLAKSLCAIGKKEAAAAGKTEQKPPAKKLSLASLNAKPNSELNPFSKSPMHPPKHVASPLLGMPPPAVPSNSFVPPINKPLTIKTQEKPTKAAKVSPNANPATKPAQAKANQTSKPFQPKTNAPAKAEQKSPVPKTTGLSKEKSPVIKELFKSQNGPIGMMTEGKKGTKRKRDVTVNWQWVGRSKLKQVNGENEDGNTGGKRRPCYKAVRHSDGDMIRVKDCVLVKSGNKEKDLPFIAKVADLWKKEDTGDMMMSLLWYYRPEHTSTDKLPHLVDQEVFASRHRDQTSVACIEDRCYVLTFNQFCRYKAELCRRQTGSLPRQKIVPNLDPNDPSRNDTSDSSSSLSSGGIKSSRMPTSEELASKAIGTVYLCRRVYDFKRKRVLKNPRPDSLSSSSLLGTLRREQGDSPVDLGMIGRRSTLRRECTKRKYMNSLEVSPMSNHTANMPRLGRGSVTPSTASPSFQSMTPTTVQSSTNMVTSNKTTPTILRTPTVRALSSAVTSPVARGRAGIQPVQLAVGSASSVGLVPVRPTTTNAARGIASVAMSTPSGQVTLGGGAQMAAGGGAVPRLGFHQLPVALIRQPIGPLRPAPGNAGRGAAAVSTRPVAAATAAAGFGVHHLPVMLVQPRLMASALPQRSALLRPTAGHGGIVTGSAANTTPQMAPILSLAPAGAVVLPHQLSAMNIVVPSSATGLMPAALTAVNVSKQNANTNANNSLAASSRSTNNSATATTSSTTSTSQKTSSGSNKKKSDAVVNGNTPGTGAAALDLSVTTPDKPKRNSKSQL